MKVEISNLVIYYGDHSKSQPTHVKPPMKGAWWSRDLFLNFGAQHIFGMGELGTSNSMCSLMLTSTSACAIEYLRKVQHRDIVTVEDYIGNDPTWPVRWLQWNDFEDQFCCLKPF